MSFTQLPDEIIQNVLYHLSPEDTLFAFELVSRRCARVANEPLIWKHHCINSFRYWHPEHEYDKKISWPTAEVDWKSLYMHRRRGNAHISKLFEEILLTKVGRYKNFGSIGGFGYDAKDFLLEQCHTDESVEDVLPRRYFGQAVLDSIHRSIGIEEWRMLSTPGAPEPPLERVLGAFDMFVMDSEAGDVNDISTILDEKTTEFRSTMPMLEDLTPRQKALALNRWVREQNLVGLKDPQTNYRNLRNCLIGQALRHPEHQSLPIVSSAIFCGMARRIGLDASCCNYPGHIHVIITSSRIKDLDNNTVPQTNARPDRMYLDPWGNDNEVVMEELEDRFRSFGAFGGTMHPDISMMPASAISIVKRTGANINATCATALENPASATPELTQLLNGPSVDNLTACLYASMWAVLILTPPSTWAELDFFLTRFARTWPEDAWLVSKHLVPRAPNRLVAFGRHAGQREDAWKVLRTIQQSDQLPPPLFRRCDAGNENVPYKIGQVFCHKRYGYLGVITGWSAQGTRDATRQRSNGDGIPTEHDTDTDVINRLRLDNKTYYTYLPEASKERFVVAEENIDIINDARALEDEAPFRYAGKYFKRFDRDTCTFVSNIREQYPDD